MSYMHNRKPGPGPAPRVSPADDSSTLGAETEDLDPRERPHDRHRDRERGGVSILEQAGCPEVARQPPGLTTEITPLDSLLGLLPAPLAEQIRNAIASGTTEPKPEK